MGRAREKRLPESAGRQCLDLLLRQRSNNEATAPILTDSLCKRPSIRPASLSCQSTDPLEPRASRPPRSNLILHHGLRSRHRAPSVATSNLDLLLQAATRSSALCYPAPHASNNITHAVEADPPVSLCVRAHREIIINAHCRRLLCPSLTSPAHGSLLPLFLSLPPSTHPSSRLSLFFNRTPVLARLCLSLTRLSLSLPAVFPLKPGPDHYPHLIRYALYSPAYDPTHSQSLRISDRNLPPQCWIARFSSFNLLPIVHGHRYISKLLPTGTRAPANHGSTGEQWCAIPAPTQYRKLAILRHGHDSSMVPAGGKGKSSSCQSVAHTLVPLPSIYHPSSSPCFANVGHAHRASARRWTRLSSRLSLCLAPEARRGSTRATCIASPDHGAHQWLRWLQWGATPHRPCSLHHQGALAATLSTRQP